MAVKKIKPDAPPITGGRLLPFNKEAEQSVFACALIDDDVAYYVLDKLQEDDFYSEAHRLIYRAMYNIKARGSKEKVDFITLVNALEQKDGIEENNLQKAGGTQYIAMLSNLVPDTSNYENYVKIVREKSILRQLIHSQSDIIDRALKNEDAENLLKEGGEAIYQISAASYRTGLVGVGDTVNEVVEEIHKRMDPRYRFGLPTGFAGIQDITNGLQPSNLIIIGARPGVGKTAFGMNLITNVAQNTERTDENGKLKKYKCAVFCMEMSSPELIQRMLSSLGQVPLDRILKGNLNDEDWIKLHKAKKKLAECEIYIDETAAVKPMDIFNKCTKLAREQGLDIVLIDYLQLMEPDKPAENRTLAVGSITRFLKIMAKTLKIPVLLLSQLSRKKEDRADKTPQLSDLRESGSIEQDADVVMFIHRDGGKENLGENTRSEIIFGKHRNGRLGVVPLRWVGEFVRFEDDLDDPKTRRAAEIVAVPAGVGTAPVMTNDYDDYEDI